MLFSHDRQLYRAYSQLEVMRTRSKQNRKKSPAPTSLILDDSVWWPDWLPPAADPVGNRAGRPPQGPERRADSRRPARRSQPDGQPHLQPAAVHDQPVGRASERGGGHQGLLAGLRAVHKYGNRGGRVLPVRRVERFGGARSGGSVGSGVRRGQDAGE